MTPERRLDVREGRLESTILTRTFGIVALAALAVRRAGAFAAPKLVIPFSFLALVGCGHDGRDATVSDETRLAGLQATLAAATDECGNRGLPRDYGCGRRLEQRTQEVLDALDGLNEPTTREHIDHALNTVASKCDACETRLREARP